MWEGFSIVLFAIFGIKNHVPDDLNFHSISLIQGNLKVVKNF